MSSKPERTSMEASGERPHSSSHRGGGGGGGGGGGVEFFICFTARPSSSSSATGVMRVPSSKSLMSPARGRDPAAAPSLSASLSRRLRSSRSLKGAQSPMFPGGRRKSCALEPAEPSSPKVTCIGQVRVKSKKKHHRIKSPAARSRSQRAAAGGEASFRRTAEPEERLPLPLPLPLPAHKHQGWVQQLPLAICDALRSLGSDFNCFLPCGRLCSSSSTRDEDGAKPIGGAASGDKRPTDSGSCAAVFARWLMAIHESEEGRQRGIAGLVVEERERADVGLLAARRERGGVEEVESKPAAQEEEEARLSVCVPPSNALLLMRCRSDPVRMAALASRFWDSPAVRTQVVEEHNADEESEEDQDLIVGKKEKKKREDEEKLGGKSSCQDAQDAAIFEETGEAEKETKAGEWPQEVVQAVALGAKEAEEEVEEDVRDRDQESAVTAGTAAASQGQLEPNREGEEEEMRNETESHEREEEEEIKGRLLLASGCSRARQKIGVSKSKEVSMRRSLSSKDKERRRHSFSSDKDARRHSFSTEREVRRASFSADGEGRGRWSFSLNKENVRPPSQLLAKTERKEEEEEERSSFGHEEVDTTENAKKLVPIHREEATEEAAKERECEEESSGAEKKEELPDCLLLMMYEPKLSMEVSKETWVCSTDFLRWRPHHHPAAAATATGYCDRPTGDETKDDPGEGQCSENNVGESSNPSPPPLQAVPAPAPPSATAVKLKLLCPGAAACGPLVLTRCKSEPMRSAARLAPDWKSRHQPIGAIGF